MASGSQLKMGYKEDLSLEDELFRQLHQQNRTRKTCRRDHSTVKQRSLNFRVRCLGLWTSLATHFTAIKISFLGNIFGMVMNIFV
ncbi:hypothetical protein ACSBR1_033832 [Camellia fascicularis]